MSWCCLALRSSAEQKGNKASTKMAEVFRLRTRGGDSMEWPLPEDRRAYLRRFLEGWDAWPKRLLVGTNEVDCFHSSRLSSVGVQKRPDRKMGAVARDGWH
jgi:hypothetical protein